MTLRYKVPDAAHVFVKPSITSSPSLAASRPGAGRRATRGAIGLAARPPGPKRPPRLPELWHPPDGAAQRRRPPSADDSAGDPSGRAIEDATRPPHATACGSSETVSSQLAVAKAHRARLHFHRSRASLPLRRTYAPRPDRAPMGGLLPSEPRFQGAGPGGPHSGAPGALRTGRSQCA